MTEAEQYPDAFSIAQQACQRFPDDEAALLAELTKMMEAAHDSGHQELLGNIGRARMMIRHGVWK